MAERLRIVIPGDEPVQISDSAHLERLAPWGEVVVHTDRPPSEEKKLARVEGARVILNSRSSVSWREADFQRLPALGMIAT